MKISHIVAASAVVASLASAVPAAALSTTLNTNLNASAAGVTAQSSADAKLQVRITTGKSRADQEIDRRVTALTELSAKISGMTRLSASQQASLSSGLQTQIANLGTLKTKIDAVADITTLKADIKSITDAYRIYLVVLPQARIAAETDAIGKVTDTLTQLGTKLDARIAAAVSAGNNTAAIAALRTDMNAQIATAGVKAQAAVDATAALQPDNGDKTVLASNNKAFADARADLKASRTALTAARQDAAKIVAALKAFNASAAVQASSTATTTAH